MMKVIIEPQVSFEVYYFYFRMNFNLYFISIYATLRFKLFYHWLILKAFTPIFFFTIQDTRLNHT